MSARRAVRIVVPHQQVGDVPDYHEWISTSERVRADRLGRLNPRMWAAAWTRWRCNNLDCPAAALVSEDGIRALIEEAE